MKLALHTLVTSICCFGLLLSSAFAQAEDEHQATVVEGAGWGLSMALQNDLPAFSYYTAAGNVEFSWWDAENLSWVRETVHVGAALNPSSSGNWIETSLLFADGGQPHIFYTQDGTRQLYHAWKTAGTWQKEAITSAGNGGAQPQVSLCNSGFCVCFYNRSEQNLWVAEGAAGSWSTTRLEAQGSASGLYCDIEELPSGNAAIAFYDSGTKVLKYTEKFNGEWDQPSGLGDPSSLAWGLYPDLVVTPNGNLEIYHYRSSGSASDGNVLVTARVNGVWNGSTIDGPYAGSYPSFIHRSNGRVIGIYRRLAYSGLFGNSGSVVRYEEIPGYSPLKGRNTISAYGCVAKFEHMKILENSDGSLFMAAFNPTSCYGSPVNVQLLSRMVEGDPPGQEPFDFKITVQGDDSSAVTGARVELNFNDQVVSARTGEDGKVTFADLRGMGAYVLTVTRAGYDFDTIEGTLSYDQSRLVIGTPRPIQITGVVVDDEERPLGSPKLLLNGSRQITINQQTGVFTIPVEYGDSYTLSIKDTDRVFLNPDVSGKIYGDVAHRFVGYPK